MPETPESVAVHLARTEEQLKGYSKAVARLAAAVERWEQVHREEVEALKKDLDDIRKASETTRSRVDLIIGNARAFGFGFAAAFTFIGTAIGAGITSALEIFK